MDRLEIALRLFEETLIGLEKPIPEPPQVEPVNYPVPMLIKSSDVA